MESAIAIIFQLAILIFSVVIHEVAHGLAANALGDSTAKHAGRLTLNPLKHLDPVGSVIVPFLSVFFGGGFIGWAKPVPYNPYNLQVSNRDLGSAIVGAAGPLTNILIAVFFGLLIRSGGFWSGLLGNAAGPTLQLMTFIVVINLWLATFNLLPIPPLDGSKVLFYFLPATSERFRMALEQFGFFIVVLFIFFVPALFVWLSLFVRILLRLIVGI